LDFNNDREEQWRSVYNELELFLKANLHTEAHEKVLDCFRTCRNPENGGKGQGVPAAAGNSTNIPMNLALSSMPLLTDSPASPPSLPPTKRIRVEEVPLSSTTTGGTGVGGRLTLLDLWTRRTEKIKPVSMPPLKLYPNRTEEKGREKGNKMNES